MNKMKPGFVRIIGGEWRSRRLPIPDSEGLRPTPDRVRETLFNWLASTIQGAHCLDLFAGSGALGFEALSRGAQSCTMVDQSALAVKSLQTMAELLKTDRAIIYQASLPNGLHLPKQPFDIVFVDPPYNANVLFSTCQMLESQSFLSDEAYIYLEAKQIIKDNELPSNWRIIKSKQAGQVNYHLARRERVT